jgi:uncharacterized membrane protein (DUF106 family)
MVFENALYGVLIIGASVSFLIAVLYKVLVNQDEVQKIKDKMNELKEKSEEARDKGNQDQMSEHTQEMMKYSSKQMKMTLKPMAVTFLIVIPLFWFVFPNLYPDATVNFNQSSTLEYRGVERGISLDSSDPLKVTVDGEQYEKDDVFNLEKYRLQVKNYNEDKQTLKLNRIAVKLPFSLPFFGKYLGWLGWYIIVAIGLGQVFRKLLGAM